MPKRLTPRSLPVRKSRVGWALLQAYRHTRYGVMTHPPFALQIGQASGSLRSLMAQHQCDSAAYITACNPQGRRVKDSENARRQAALAAHLRQHRYVFFSGLGEGADASWNAEPSYLVLGMSLRRAKAVGRRWRQNAIVWCDAGAVAQLVLLR